MPNHAFKLIELVGVSNKSYADATNAAVKRAAKTLHGLSWFEVVELRGSIEAGRVAEYQVKLKVGFKLD